MLGRCLKTSATLCRALPLPCPKPAQIRACARAGECSIYALICPSTSDRIGSLSFSNICHPLPCLPLPCPKPAQIRACAGEFSNTFYIRTDMPQHLGSHRVAFIQQLMPCVGNQLHTAPRYLCLQKREVVFPVHDAVRFSLDDQHRSSSRRIGRHPFVPRVKRVEPSDGNMPASERIILQKRDKVRIRGVLGNAPGNGLHKGLDHKMRPS